VLEEIRRSAAKLWKFIGDLSTFYWLVTVVPALVAGTSGYLRGMLLEQAFLIFLGIVVLVLMAVSYWKKPSEERPHYWRLMFPVGAVLLFVTLPLFVGSKRIPAGRAVRLPEPVNQQAPKEPQPSNSAAPSEATTADGKAEQKPATNPVKVAKKNTSPRDATTAPTPSPGYTVTNPTGSIVNQGSPDYGNQTVNNAPVARSIDVARFTDAIKETRGAANLIKAGTSDDIGNLYDQLHEAIRSAKWQIRTGPFFEGGREPRADGLECYSSDLSSPSFIALQKAFEGEKLPCIPIGHLYTRSFGDSITILVGRNVPH
jgi:hypothetical protein